MYDKLMSYGQTLKTNGATMTPIEIIEGLLNTMEVLRLKKSLYTNNIKVLEEPENTKACISLIQNSKDENSLVFYTLVYVKLRNPIVNELITNIIRGM